MKVKVKLFAILREKAGTESVEISLKSGTRVSDMLKTLQEEFPALSELIPRCAVAINGKVVPENECIKEEDEIALLPPVSGGN